MSVDASGYFQISGVPSGDIQLLIQDGASSGVVNISNVVEQEHIEIQLSLSSGSPTLVNQIRSAAKVQLCHRSDANRYHLISVGASAEPDHRAHGDGAVGEFVQADPSKIFDANCQLIAPYIRITKTTNGADANVAPGPSIPVGNPVTWNYMVSNVGTGLLTNVIVTDDKNVAVNCGGLTTLAAGQSMTCTATGVAVAGQYRNVGTVTAVAGALSVSASDASHYFGEQITEESGPKVKLCHRTGSGRYQPIEVGASAERAHRAHGDGKIGEAAPREPGKVFLAGCAVG